MRFKISISIIIFRGERRILNPMSLSCDYASQKIDSRQREYRGSRKVSGEVWVKRESSSSTADKWKRWATRRLTRGPSTPLFRAYLFSLCVDSGTDGLEIVLESGNRLVHPAVHAMNLKSIHLFPRYGLQIWSWDTKKKEKNERKYNRLLTIRLNLQIERTPDGYVRGTFTFFTYSQDASF